MREFFGRTWLPTLLFALPVFLFELTLGGAKPLPVGTVTLYILVVVPTTWWLTTASRGHVSLARGAVGGAFCGAVLVLIPAFIATIAVAVNPGDGSGSLATGMGFVFLAVLMAIFVPVGTGIGTLTALLQKRGPVERLS